MAYEVSLTTLDNVLHPNAYEIPVQLNFYKIGSTGNIVFNVYHDSASRLILSSPVSSHIYGVISASDYNTYFSSAVNTLISACYLYAKATLDTSSGKVDSTGNLIMQSWLSGGKDV